MTTSGNQGGAGSSSSKIDASSNYNAVQQTLDVNHGLEQSEDLSQQIKDVIKQYESLKQQQQQQRLKNINTVLSKNIDRWEKQSIEKIKSTAKSARDRLKRLIGTSKRCLTNLETKLSNGLHSNRKAKQYTESDVEICKKLVKEYKEELDKMSAIKVDI
jgi:uncharacterized protein (DUF885 family)